MREHSRGRGPTGLESNVFNAIPELTPRQGGQFWAKVDATGDCWEWTGYLDTHGYGRFSVWPLSIAAHRVIWTILVGPIPDEYQIDHLCYNPSCVNPDHLEPVTMEENHRRSRRLGMWLTYAHSQRTHCPAGHPYDEANTARRASRGDGRWRTCRACEMQRERDRPPRIRKPRVVDH